MIGKRVRKDKTLAFFDLGHGSIRLAAMKQDCSEVSFYQVKCLGLAKGKVIDQGLFNASITSLLQSSALSGAELYGVVSVPTLQTRSLRRSIHHKCGGTYRSSDYSSLYEAACDSGTSELDEVIDVYVAQASLDEKPVDPFSFGQHGRDFRAQVLLATHPKVLLADVLAGMNSCEIEVSEFRSGFFGLARALSALRPGVENAVLIDFGHSATSGVMTIGGAVQQVFSVPAGSNYVTKDLMVALGEGWETAEGLKIKQGLALGQDGLDLGKFIRPRVAEILALSLKNFAIYAKALDGGLLFCGNGAQLNGFAPYAGRALGVEAPFICSLTGKTAGSFLDAKIVDGANLVDSGWLTLLSHVRAYSEEQAVRRFESDAKPLAKLRPLWTWLSELSR